MWSPLLGIYLFCLGVGAIYILFNVIMGEIGSDVKLPGSDHGGLDVGQADVGAIDAGGVDIGGDGLGEVGVSPVATVGAQDLPWFSPLIIASFVTCFGGVGLIARNLLHLGDLGSLIFAMPTAIGMAAVIFLLVAKLLFGSSASSEATMSEVIGNQAEVVTGIPESGLGEIAYVCKGFRYKAPARSSDAQPIEVGAKVRVLKSDGYIMTVKKS